MMCFNHVTSPILKIVYNFIPFAHGLLHPGHTSLPSLAPLEAHCFMMSSESFMSWNLWQNGWHSNSWYLKRCPPAEQGKSCPNQGMLGSMFVPGYFLNMDRVQSKKRLLSTKFQGMSVTHSRSTKTWATKSNPSALVPETVSGLCVRHYSDANIFFIWYTYLSCWIFVNPNNLLLTRVSTEVYPFVIFFGPEWSLKEAKTGLKILSAPDIPSNLEVYWCPHSPRILWITPALCIWNCNSCS